MAIKNLEQRRAEKLAKKAARANSGNSRAAIAEKARKAQKIAHVRSGMIGYTLEWADTNPLGNDGDQPATATNKNKNQFNCAQDMWDDLLYRKWICMEVFTWEVEVILSFKLLRPRPDKTHREDIINVRHTGRLRDRVNGEDTPINEEIERQIMAEFMANSSRPDNDKNKGVFEIAKYTIKCVGV